MLAMRRAHLSRYQNVTIIAGDVGFIGYFTMGQICDIDGLVGGRRAALQTPMQRLAGCAGQRPEVLFVTSGQAENLGQLLYLQDWKVCSHFDFTNVLGDDRHYLMVLRSSTSVPCPQS